MRFRQFLLISFIKDCYAYIQCNDYFDIYNPIADPIFCSLKENTSANRVKYTELPHELGWFLADLIFKFISFLVIFDDDSSELIYTMDWNGDQGRWELSTAAQLSLESRAFKSVEYDAEIRTSEGLDLVKTAFKIVAKQVYSKSFSFEEIM